MKKLLIMGCALLLFSTFVVGWERPERVKLDTSTRRIVKITSPILEANYAQAALHQDSVSNAWRLTLGTPLITIEY